VLAFTMLGIARQSIANHRLNWEEHMNKKLGGLIFTAGILATGCDTERAAIPANSTAQQIGRYQFIEKTKYDDGTIEYACLDTATGEINYASIPADSKKINAGSFSCAN
jgi:hypothetical protein